jgi:predicted acetyltransferase
MAIDADSALRQAGRRDIRRLAELWTHAFPGERTVEQRVRQLEEGGVYGGIEQAWYIERQGRIAGAFRGYALTQYLHGAPVPMLGLAAVAVAADARRSGLGGRLCAAAVRIGRERGDLVSVLYPFRPDFYHRLGWGLVGSLHAHRFAPESLPVQVGHPRVYLAPGGLLPAVFECYDAVARSSHGLLQRTPAVWRQHLAREVHHIHALQDGAEVRGYVMVAYGPGPVPDRKTLVVQELIARDDDARAELLSWISLQRDSWRVVAYDALPEERFDLLLAEPRPYGYRPRRTLWAPTARIIRGPMLRLLDVPGALEARSAWPEAAPLRFTLTVRDPLLPENEGPWQVDFDGRQVRCTRAGAAPVELHTDAATLAQIHAGELRVSEAARFGRAEVRGPAAPLDALFQAGRTLRLLDEF